MSDTKTLAADAAKPEIPHGNFAGLRRYFREDLVSGFLVFLIALPLCLGIALASGFPAIAGVFTAIVGAFTATFISNSELTIKGPAAGMIVIVIGCVGAFGGDGALGEGGFTDADMAAYRMALGVAVAAAVLQILFGLFKGGILGEFFPLSAVHGMLAAIGVIIMVKQIPVALGVGGKGEPLEMIRDIPNYIREMNPEIALIGGVGLIVMFVWPFVRKLNRFINVIPAPVIVLALTIPMGMYFDLTHEHSYNFHGHEYMVGESYLVSMPDRAFGMFDYITPPDFSVLYSAKWAGTAWRWVFMFFIIGTLESVLSAKAIDVIDPWKRKADMNRDILGVGCGNLVSACVGGLPMISEIVRSKANIDNGARTRFANLYHGAFLLLCVALIPTALHRIPLAALASMLIYTGFRLTHPAEFVAVYKIGKEQLLIFVATLVGVLATDLLWGIVIGIAVKLIVHWYNGAPVRSILRPYYNMPSDGAQSDDPNVVRVRPEHAMIFSNWLLIRRHLIQVGIRQHRSVQLDLSNTRLIDHSVMEKLHELQEDFQREGITLEIVGTEQHEPFSDHPFAGRKRKVERNTQPLSQEDQEDSKHITV